MTKLPDWNTKVSVAWDRVWEHFINLREPYYFNDRRGYLRCVEDAERGNERAGRWLAQFTKEMLK